MRAALICACLLYTSSHAQIVLAQISVGVKVNHMEVGKALDRSSDCSQRHQMFTADHQRTLAAVQYLAGKGLDLLQSGGRIAKGKFQVAAVKDSIVSEILVLIGAVGLDPEGLSPDCTCLLYTSRCV